MCIDIDLDHSIVGERDTIRGVQIRAVYVDMDVYVYHNSSACHAYVLWAELGHSLFLYGKK